MHQSLAIPIEELRGALAGRIITASDSEYDRARQVFSGSIDKFPGAIVRAASAADVAHAVRIARQRGLELAVRSGGHSGAGHSTSDGGLVLDLRDMKALEIDTVARTAWAEPGLTAAEYTAAVGAHGLATGFGDTGSVGISGITLGGGIGFLTRKYGLTIDSLLAAEIVTASGEVVHASADSHPDLFWAIRGGGGNFGVVTRMHFKLHLVDRVLGGMLLLPASADVIARFIEAADAAPEELTTIVNVMPAPPMPFVPREAHGRLVAMALMCYAGDIESGERALAPFRNLATPIADMVKPIAYPQIYPPDDESYRPKAIGRTMFIHKVDSGVAETALGFLTSSDAPLRVAQFRVLGGAMARVPSDATAFAHRTKRIMANVGTFFSGPEDRERRERWVLDFVSAIHQGDDDAYVNFVGDEGQQRVRAAYPGQTWARLAEIKARYDPSNVFRMNHNISPAAKEEAAAEGRSH